GDVSAAFADILQPGPGRRFSKGPSLPGKIGAMLEDHSGALWFGLEGARLAVYEHGHVENVFTGDAQDSNDEILTLFDDQSGGILGLTANRLLRIKDRRVLDAAALPKHFISSGHLLANPSGGTWVVGAREGVYLYNNGAMLEYPLPDFKKP